MGRVARHLSHHNRKKLPRTTRDFADPMAVPELVYPENFYRSG